jgi:hypothetical protein
MIVVLGRPRAARPSHSREPAEWVPAGLCVSIANAAVAAGARVELVGSIGDDASGDAVVVGLSRYGIGHAALLRDPAVHTPEVGALPGSLPRLDRADVELGLGYLVDFGVLLLAEPLDPEAEAGALDEAAFHGAQVVAVLPRDLAPSDRLGAEATVLEAPADDAGAFGALVGRFAAELERGVAAADGLAHAAAATGWERRS